MRPDCSLSKRPVRTFRSFSIGTYGTRINLPFCRARFRSVRLCTCCVS
jgi:hypothetical protein